MKRVNHVLTTPSKVSDLMFEDYLDDGVSNAKAERNAVKAHRKLKHQLS